MALTHAEIQKRYVLRHPKRVRASNQRSQNRLRDSRRTAGVCPLCGMESSIGCLYCDHHLELNRERMHRRRAASKKDQP
jgi:hypothetical protein